MQTSETSGCPADEEENCIVKEEIECNESDNLDENFSQTADRVQEQYSCVVLLNRLSFICKGGNFIYQSQSCCKSFSSLKMMACHLLIHETPNVTKDDTSSSFKLSSSSTVDKSGCKKRLKGVHECNFCNKRFKFKSHLEDHYRFHPYEKPYKCHLCSNAFKYRTSLLTHKRSHSGEKPYKCNVCGKSFNSRYDLASHMSVTSYFIEPI